MIGPKADIQVIGVVTDENGDPLPGTTITVSGSSTGAITDVNGGYVLTAGICTRA